MKSLGRAPIQYNWCPNKKGSFGHGWPQAREHEGTAIASQGGGPGTDVLPSQLSEGANLTRVQQTGTTGFHS